MSADAVIGSTGVAGQADDWLVWSQVERLVKRLDEGACNWLIVGKKREWPYGKEIKTG
jgi:hypothetical protein